jgi:RNA polymerase primary sigma factor
MKDLRIEIRFKNNILYKKIKDEGFHSIKQFCIEFSKYINTKYSTTPFYYLNFKRPPITNKNMMPNKKECKPVDGLDGFFWVKIAVKIAEFLHTTPEELFPEHLREARENFYIIEAESKRLFAEQEKERLTPINIEEHIEALELKEKINMVLKTLPPREEKLIRDKFGLGDQIEPQKVNDLAKESGITRQRINQIEKKALRKLRHHSRSKYLRDFV